MVRTRMYGGTLQYIQHGWFSKRAGGGSDGTRNTKLSYLEIVDGESAGTRREQGQRSTPRTCSDKDLHSFNNVVFLKTI